MCSEDQTLDVSSSDTLAHPLLSENLRMTDTKVLVCIGGIVNMEVSVLVSNSVVQPSTLEQARTSTVGVKLHTQSS